jgi:excinuclease ABC subunit C
LDQQTFSSLQQTLPNAPGIYKYYGAGKQLLYIGKAKNIRKRVSSYFTKNNHNYKTAELVRQINSIEFTIVKSEHDALLLENALIKEFKPRFNIDLKDDKTYPYIVIKKEPFPRVFLTRRKINDGSTYLGPFTSASKVRDLLSFIKTHIPLRTCSLNLSAANIEKQKYKVCLEYHLGNCKGPCTGLQSAQNYEASLQEIKHILKGNLTGIISRYKEEQAALIAELSFEKAQQIQQKIDALKNYTAQSVIVNPRLGDLDVFATALFESSIVVSYLAVRNGTIINSGNQVFQSPLENAASTILPQAVFDFLNKYNSDARELVVPFDLGYGFESFRVTVPKSGEKKKLLEMAATNASYHAGELKRQRLTDSNKTTLDLHQLLDQLRLALSLENIPVHIECFDNSNFQGGYPVSAMVCFKDGIPSKKDYRHFNVKTVDGINDFATMKEAVGRRYSRLKTEGSTLPQLVIIDGGKGQLGAAMEAIHELGLSGKMTLIGLAKNVEEIFFPGDMESLKLGYNSPELLFLRRIRDEVHRFGITFHRKKRSEGTFKNELEHIKGIGTETANQLLIHFRSVAGVKGANLEKLVEIIGKAKAFLIKSHFESTVYLNKDNK